MFTLLLCAAPVLFWRDFAFCAGICVACAWPSKLGWKVIFDFGCVLLPLVKY